jgi:hypothetical protein
VPAVAAQRHAARPGGGERRARPLADQLAPRCAIAA